MRRASALFASTVAGLLIGGMLAAPPAGADTTLTTCNEATLRSAVFHGGVVTFGVDCPDLVLTKSMAIGSSLQVDIEGNGHSVVLDGAGVTRHFVVSGGTLT